MTLFLSVLVWMRLPYEFKDTFPEILSDLELKVELRVQELQKLGCPFLLCILALFQILLYHREILLVLSLLSFLLLLHEKVSDLLQVLRCELIPFRVMHSLGMQRMGQINTLH